MKTTDSFVRAAVLAAALGTACSNGDETGAPTDAGSGSGGENSGSGGGASSAAGKNSGSGGTSSGSGGAAFGNAGTTSSSGAATGSGGSSSGSGGKTSASGGSSSASGGNASGGASSGGTTGSGGKSTGSGGKSTGGASGAGGGASSGDDLWRLAYHPCYQFGEVSAANVPWTRITHLTVGYMWPKADGSSYSLDVPSGTCGDLNGFKSQVGAYVTSGHAAGRKVTMMLGGAGGNPNNIWNTATTTGNVGGFAQNIIKVLTDMGLDGVDLDWEDNVDAAGMVRLAKELRSRWANGVITIPTGSTGADAAGLAGAKDAVDAFMPMTYMVVEQWGGWRIPVPLTPLGAYQSNPYSVEIARQKWVAAGVPASKLMMGVASFGTVWTDTNGDNRAPVAPYSNTDLNGPAETETRASASDNSVTQKWLNRTLAAHQDLVESWDDVGKCSYWHAPGAGNLVGVTGPSGGTVKVGAIFYESPRSMAEKVKYIDANGMKGLMFWTLSQMLDGSSSPILEAL